MDGWAPVIVVAYVVAVAALVWANQRGDDRARFVSKPVASALFVALAWVEGAAGSPWGMAMLAGFVGCWWGDVLLMPADRRAFLAGIAAFALGHVGFAVAFVLRGGDPVWGGVTAVGLVPLAGAVWWWLRPHVRGVMRGAVIGYIVVICCMVAAAASTAAVPGEGRELGLLAGAMLFWLSDLCVARERFVQSGFVNRAVGLPLYYGAQLVLALSCAP